MPTNPISNKQRGGGAKAEALATPVSPRRTGQGWGSGSSECKTKSTPVLLPWDPKNLENMRKTCAKTCKTFAKHAKITKIRV